MLTAGSRSGWRPRGRGCTRAAVLRRARAAAARRQRSREGAARGEKAAGRQVHRARDLALEHHADAPSRRVRREVGGQKSGRVGVRRALEDRFWPARSRRRTPDKAPATRSETRRTVPRSWLMKTIGDAEIAVEIRAGAPECRRGPRRRGNWSVRRARSAVARSQSRGRCRPAAAGRPTGRTDSGRAGVREPRARGRAPAPWRGAPRPPRRVQLQRLLDDVADRESRVERAPTDPGRPSAWRRGAAQIRPPASVAKVASLRTRCGPPSARSAKDSAPERRLAGPAFADDAQDLAGTKLQIDAVERRAPCRPRPEGFRQVLDAEQRLRHGRPGRDGGRAPPGPGGPRREGAVSGKDRRRRGSGPHRRSRGRARKGRAAGRRAGARPPAAMRSGVEATSARV